MQAMFMLYERNCKHEYDKSTLVNIAGKTWQTLKWTVNIILPLF